VRTLRQLCGATLLLVTAQVTGVSAADMPVKAPTIAAPASNWTGFYVGATVGAGQDSSKTNEVWSWATNYPTGTLIGIGGGPLFTTTAPLNLTTNFSDQYHHSSLGVTGGLDAGYNWQTGRMVYGLEGDFSLSSQSNNVNYSAQPVAGVFPPLPNFFFIPNTTQGWSSQEKIDWLTTLRGRVGVTQDGSLWYGTAGLAAARISTNFSLLSSPGSPGLVAAAGGVGPGTFAQWGLPGGLTQAHFGTTKIGWVVGGGVETSLSRLLGFGASNWTTKLEYLFADLGTVNNAIGTGLTPVCATTCTTPAVGTTSFTSSIHVYEQILRVGVNYNFGGGPTVAAPSSIYTKAPPAAYADWRGYYVGFNVGAAEDSSKTNELWLWNATYPTGALVGVNGGPLAATTTPLNTTTTYANQYPHSSLGAIGGVDGGYNWQRNRWVFGLEGDFSLTSQNNSATYLAQPVHSIFPPLPNFFFVPGTTQGWTSQEKIDWLTTVRGRVGVAQDNSLWYGTAGVAAARISSNYALVSSPGFAGLTAAAGGQGPGTFGQWGLPGGLAQAHFGTTKFGWVVGGGVEKTLNRLLGLGASNWTARLEYLFADLGTVNNTVTTGLVPVCATTCAVPAVGTTTFTSSTHIYDQILRVGVNYRFGEPAAAVPATMSK
jgi:outer membrane immunogenic protein